MIWLTIVSTRRQINNNNIRVKGMSCCSETHPSKRHDCPECGKSCLPVKMQTIFHQVVFPDNQNTPEGDYAFCPNHECLTGYFSASEIIPKSKLHAFENGRQALLCHCFDVSQPAYRAAIQSSTHEAIKAFVVQQTKVGNCACEARNPSGRCCLADFARMEKAAGQA